MDRLLVASITPTWDDELALNAQLFFEADRLENQAYEIIGGKLANTDADAWRRFTQVKARADAKRTEAYQDWMRIRRGMKKRAR